MTLLRATSEEPGPRAMQHDCDCIQQICHRSVAIHPIDPRFLFPSLAVGCVGGQDLLESESPVAGGVGVPVGKGLHPALKQRALDNVAGERRGRHVESRVSQLTREWKEVVRLSGWNTR